MAQRFRPGATHADKILWIDDVNDMVVALPEDSSVDDMAVLLHKAARHAAKQMPSGKS